MSNKKYFLLLIAIIILSFSAFAYVSDSPRASVTLVNQDPDPVEPGQVVTLKFKIENQGAQTNQDVILRLIPRQPFSLYGDQAEKNVGKLAAGSVNNEAIYVEYNLKIDENAVEEETEIEVELQIGEGKILYTNGEFKVDIQTHDASLDIKSIALDPNPIPPGQTGRVTLTVKNLADSLLKDIKIKLDLSSATLPLAPYQSSSERIIPQLQTGVQDTLTFDIIATPEAVPGLYKIPLNITFSDEQGSKTTINDILAVQIGDIPNLKVFLKKSSAPQAQSRSTITAAFANAGPTDIKFLEFTLQDDPSYKLLSSSNYFYIGDVDSDDTESVDLDIFINSNQPTLKIPIKVNFIDANNKPYEIYSSLELNLLSSDEMVTYGITPKSSSMLIIILIILVIAGFIAYKKWYKKRKPKT